MGALIRLIRFWLDPKPKKDWQQKRLQRLSGIERTASAVSGLVFERGPAAPPTVRIAAGARVSALVTRELALDEARKIPDLPGPGRACYSVQRSELVSAS